MKSRKLSRYWRMLAPRPRAIWEYTGAQGAELEAGARRACRSRATLVALASALLLTWWYLAVAALGPWRAGPAYAGGEATRGSCFRGVRLLPRERRAVCPPQQHLPSRSVMCLAPSLPPAETGVELSATVEFPICQRLAVDGSPASFRLAEARPRGHRLNVPVSAQRSTADLDPVALATRKDVPRLHLLLLRDGGSGPLRAP